MNRAILFFFIFIVTSEPLLAQEKKVDLGEIKIEGEGAGSLFDLRNFKKTNIEKYIKEKDNFRSTIEVELPDSIFKTQKSK